MIAPAIGARAGTQTSPTIWGLEPLALHARFWASRGVQVVVPGEPAELSERAAFFLLMEPQGIAIFDPTAALESLSHDGIDLVYMRIHDTRDRGSRERVVTDSDDRFVRFERLYDRPRHRLARAAITRDIEAARLWQSSASREGWRRLRQSIRKPRRSSLNAAGMLYDGFLDAEIAEFVRDLTRFWVRPDLTIDRAVAASAGVWVDREASIDASARLVGPIWIGAGRDTAGGALVVGPAVLWDAPEARPSAAPVRWEAASWRDAGPMKLPALRGAARAIRAKPRNGYRFAKRVFDIVFSLLALAVTLPLYPLIALLIVLEDGWPIFFAHQREGRGGREFGCLKFRSMRRNAESLKPLIAQQNQADGPQFFIDNDPRLTRVGRLLRKVHLDELPQFFNVLLGQMSVVGPRPSPFSENQFCPPWREARLSVRPGVTGLWQVMRTRAQGSDFQEWIRYDIQYVETASGALDMWIIGKTLLSIVGRSGRGVKSRHSKMDERNEMGENISVRQ